MDAEPYFCQKLGIYTIRHYTMDRVVLNESEREIDNYEYILRKNEANGRKYT